MARNRDTAAQAKPVIGMSPLNSSPKVHYQYSLRGGIRPENVKSAIETIRPHGIDLCSGVEASKGIKDPSKLKRLMEQIEQAD